MAKQLELAARVEREEIGWSEIQLREKDSKKWFDCTQRPIWNFPWIEYRRKPTPRKVPFGAEDIKPGMVFNTIPVPPDVGFTAPVRVGLDGILFIRYNHRGGDLVGWEHLAKFWLWSTDGQTWHPCEKDEVRK